jgi:4Fe-4S ferredoxin
MATTTKEVKAKNFNIERSAEEERKLSFKNETCVGCGICEKICPVEAIELGDIGAIVRTGAEEPKITIDEHKCVLCGMCDVACPVDALDLTINGKPIKEIETYPRLISSAEISDDACVYCKACERACPQHLTIRQYLKDAHQVLAR